MIWLVHPHAYKTVTAPTLAFFFLQHTPYIEKGVTPYILSFRTWNFFMHLHSKMSSNVVFHTISFNAIWNLGVVENNNFLTLYNFNLLAHFSSFLWN